MTFVLQGLIREASTMLGSEACANGRHRWSSIGGRACPHPDGVGLGVCSQGVYECTTCGAVDYGNRSGPAARDCAAGCMHGGREFYATAAQAAFTDTLPGLSRCSRADCVAKPNDGRRCTRCD